MFRASPSGLTAHFGDLFVFLYKNPFIRSLSNINLFIKICSAFPRMDVGSLIYPASEHLSHHSPPTPTLRQRRSMGAVRCTRARGSTASGAGAPVTVTEDAKPPSAWAPPTQRPARDVGDGCVSHSFADRTRLFDAGGLAGLRDEKWHLSVLF